MSGPLEQWDLDQYRYALLRIATALERMEHMRAVDRTGEPIEVWRCETCGCAVNRRGPSPSCRVCGQAR